MRSAKDYVAAIELAYGGSLDPRVSPLAILNDAGRFLVDDLHEWTFRRRPPASISFTADQAYAALPTGFSRLIRVVGDVDSVYRVRWVDLGVLQWYREQQLEIDSRYFVAVEWPTQTSQTSAPPAARLAIEPTPSANASDVFSVVYEAGWIELTAYNHVPNLPADMEGLLLDLCRADARAYRHNVPLDEARRPILEGPTLDRLKRRYGMVADHAGRIRNPSVKFNYRTGEHGPRDRDGDDLGPVRYTMTI